MNKDVIYIDIEDDITSIIEKVKESSAKVVALVPPKRATVFTSLVNLKLLKKAAESKKKRPVLVSSDDTIRALAGSLDMYVAKNLTSAPEVPEVAHHPDIPSAVIQASGISAPEAEEASEPTDEEMKEAPKKAAKKKSLKPLKGKKLPNFNDFRKKLFIGLAALVLILIGWWQAAFVLPKAEVVLETQTSSVSTEFPMVLSTKEDAKVNEEQQLLVGQRQQTELTETVEATATGEKNIGKKASGELEIENCGDEFSLVEGTRFRSSNGYIFLSKEAVSVPEGNCTIFSGSDPGEASVKVDASEPGDDYNIEETSYEIVEFSDSRNNQIQIIGSDMGGGTDEIVKVLSQEDVDNAVETVVFDIEKNQILNQLRQNFDGDVYMFDDTLQEKTADPKVNPGVGTETDKAEVTVAKTYSVIGVQRSNLEALLDEQFSEQISDQEVIVDYGLENLVTELNDGKDNRYVFRIVANGQAGPNIDTARLAEELRGKRYSEAISYAESLPGISKAEIDLSPLWVSKVPRSTDKISIAIEDLEQQQETVDSPESAPENSDQ